MLGNSYGEYSGAGEDAAILVEGDRIGIPSSNSVASNKDVQTLSNKNKFRDVSGISHDFGSYWQ